MSLSASDKWLLERKRQEQAIKQGYTSIGKNGLTNPHTGQTKTYNQIRKGK
jgi:hypothetical protein